MTDREALKEAVAQPQAGTGDALRMAREALMAARRSMRVLDPRDRTLEIIDEGIAALSAGTVEPKCVACEGKPAPENNPCAVCGLAALSSPQPSVGREPVSDPYKFDDEIAWLREAASYFAHRPTGGEDRAHWANVYNAENANKLADRLALLTPAATDGVWIGRACPDCDVREGHLHKPDCPRVAHLDKGDAG